MTNRKNSEAEIANPNWVLGSKRPPDASDFAQEIAFADHKISFVTKHASGKRVLDLGCVQHNPRNYRSKYWLHKALGAVANHLEGLDVYAQGVQFLQEHGYRVTVGDAHDFDLGAQFDVIVAGDIIEHLANLEGFFKCCKSHLSLNGKLLVSTPNPWYWRNVLKALLVGRVSNNPEHTCWFCPETLDQLARRYGMRVSEVQFGSRYLRDRLMPLPRGVRHTSFHAVIVVDTN